MSDAFFQTWGLCYKRYCVCSSTYQQWAPKENGSVWWVCFKAGPTSRLSGCAETASDCLHRAGHCDPQCSRSTSEIPPLAMEVLPNPLDSKTYNRLIGRRHWCHCGFLAVSYLRLAATCPLTCFFCHHASAALTSAPLQQCLRNLLSSLLCTCCGSWGPVAAGIVGNWAVFQGVVVGASGYCLSLNEAWGWCWWNCLESWMWCLFSRSRSYIRRTGGTCLSSLGRCTFAGLPWGHSTLNVKGKSHFWKLQEVVYFANVMKVLHCYTIFLNHMEVIQVFHTSCYHILETFSIMQSCLFIQLTVLEHLAYTRHWARDRKQGIMDSKIMCILTLHPSSVTH